MKKILLITLIMMSGVTLFAQVQRNVVIQEIGTGTWCTYCPGAANGSQQLLSSGAHVAIIEYHNGDIFANAASNARNSYYAVPGYPTAHFDGTIESVGGAACPNGNVYSTYLPLYNQAYAVLSPLVIDISGTNTGNVYDIVVSVKKVSAISGSNLKLHLVLTETNISTAPWPGSSGCMTAVHEVERLMAPNENGTDISFTTGDMQIVNLQFTKDASWVLANCKLVAFVQDNTAKTIFNGSEVALASLPAPVTVNFSGTPLNGCAPVTVNFTDASSGVNTYQWTCPGGSPSSSTVANPAITYNTLGSYDVTLVAWNSTTNRGNKMTKLAYVNPSGTPAAPTQPFGNSQLCMDAANETYSTSAVTGATSYTWDLQPPTAGTLSPNSTSCVVDWSSTFSGTAQLKVKAANSCGTSSWSNALSISLSPAPGVPGTPTGQTTVCIDAPNTAYTTSGTTPASSYFWEILPTTAGTISGTSTTGYVDWNPTYIGSATIKVKGINNGCEGPWSSTLDVTVDGGPSMYQVTGGGLYCAASAPGLPVGLNNSQVGINYTLYKDGSATSNTVPGTGSFITFGDQTAGTYTVVAQNSVSSCSSTMNGSAVITSDPEAPGVPATPQGPASPNAGTNSDYTTAGGQYATTYTWNVSPASAGVFSGNTTTGTINWNAAYTGLAQITVSGVNSCGSGTSSSVYEVTVLPAVGVSNIHGKTFAILTPNPAKNSVVLKADKGSYDVRISNFLGQEVMKVKVNANSAINLTSLTPGIYFFTISNGTSEQISRVVVTK